MNIYIKTEGKVSALKEVVTDVEKEFAQLKLKGTDLDRKLIEKIEQGKYVNSISYLDRFGYKLHYDDMSTGCKAALCVANEVEKIIDIVECGNNARDIIIALCKNGNILMEDNGMTISTQYGNEIDVVLDGYRFTQIDRLNQYISNERPFAPNMDLEGIMHVCNNEI